MYGITKYRYLCGNCQKQNCTTQKDLLKKNCLFGMALSQPASHMASVSREAPFTDSQTGSLLEEFTSTGKTQSLVVARHDIQLIHIQISVSPNLSEWNTIEGGLQSDSQTRVLGNMSNILCDRVRGLRYSFEWASFKSASHGRCTVNRYLL